MFVDPVRMVADWLDDPTNGVNAMLAALDLDGSDPAPANVTLFDSTTSMEVAFGRLPATRPCVAVSLYNVQSIDPRPVQGDARDYKPSILIRFGDTEDQTEVGLRNRDYTLRAILQSLDRFHRDENVAARQRNQIQLLAAEDTQMLAAFSPIENGELTACFLVRYWARDIQV